MCFGTDEQTSTQSTTTPLDAQIQQAGSQALNQAMAIGNQTYPGYDTSQRVAPFAADQSSAFKMIEDYTTGYQPNVYGYALQGAKAYGAAPAQTVTAPGMDPYLAAALQPAITDIQEAGAVQRNDIAAQATGAGAYGDARHGVVEADQMSNEQQAISDLTSQAYSAAYNQAAAYDMQAQQFNAQAQEAALQRQLQSGTSALGFAAQDQATQLANMNALLQSGQIQQQQQQAIADAQYEEYLRSLEWPFRQLEALTSVYSGQPISQTVTTSAPTDNTDLYAALGAIGGSLL